MTELMRNWIMGLAGASVVCTVAVTLTPDGQVKKVVQLLCGVVMAVALMSPLLRPDLSGYGWNLAKYRASAAELTEDAETLRQSLDRSIIEEKLEAYILDKARVFGTELRSADVSLRWSTEGFWYPVGAELTGAYDAALARLMEAELGIPQSAQIWRNDEDS